MSQLTVKLPDGKTPLQLRGEVERAIESLMDCQTFYVACAKIEEVFHRTFDVGAIQQQQAERGQ